jgi:hypothetical protein
MRELNENNIKTSPSVNYYNLLIRAMQIFIGICFLIITYLALHTIIVEGKSLVVPTISLGEFGLFISIFVGVILVRTFFNISEYKSSHIRNRSEYPILKNKANKYFAEGMRIQDEIDELEKNTHQKTSSTLIGNIGYFFASIVFIVLAVFLFAYMGQSRLDNATLLLFDYSFNLNYVPYSLLAVSIGLGYNILLIEFIKSFKVKNYILIGLFTLFILGLSFFSAYPSFKMQLVYNVSSYDFINIASFTSSLISGSFFHSFIQSNSEKLKWLKLEAFKIRTKLNECE